MAELIDISPLISPRIAVWPGDVGFSRRYALQIAEGANIDLSAIESTVHLGAHTDAPSHYVHPGAGIAERPLSLYYGPCQVIAVTAPRGERIHPEHIPEPIATERVLMFTGSYPDPDVFNEDFNSLSPELIHWLAEQGVRLVGIDTPSIDPFHSKALESHHAVAERDMGVLEGVVLGHVAPGRYTLIALPLRIEGADASPVRAVLLPG
ncbi:MAG: cyclase family protein [Myxococcota bacterium]